MLDLRGLEELGMTCKPNTGLTTAVVGHGRNLVQSCEAVAFARDFES